jgi:hypothetical protein
MACPVCDQVDVAGRGLTANASLVLTITDVHSGQLVIPETRITTDNSGGFAREFDLDLARHPALLGNLYAPQRRHLGAGRGYQGQRPGPLPARWLLAL